MQMNETLQHRSIVHPTSNQIYYQHCAIVVSGAIVLKSATKIHLALTKKIYSFACMVHGF